MSKSVLISIKPEWCEKIASRKKIIEVRKTRPKIRSPFKCYIYQTKDYYGNKFSDPRNGYVIGEFICDDILGYRYPFSYTETDCSISLTKFGCLSIDDVWEYGKGNDLYGWHISDLKIYDEPKELSEFGLKKSPQSWCYVMEKEIGK